MKKKAYISFDFPEDSPVERDFWPIVIEVRDQKGDLVSPDNVGARYRTPLGSEVPLSLVQLETGRYAGLINFGLSGRYKVFAGVSGGFYDLEINEHIRVRQNDFGEIDVVEGSMPSSITGFTYDPRAIRRGLAPSRYTSQFFHRGPAPTEAIFLALAAEVNLFLPEGSLGRAYVYSVAGNSVTLNMWKRSSPTVEALIGQISWDAGEHEGEVTVFQDTDFSRGDNFEITGPSDDEVDNNMQNFLISIPFRL